MNGVNNLQNQEDQNKEDDREYNVQIFDLSSEQKNKVTEVVAGFYSLEHANAFAKTYVRDSVERCRIPGASRQEIFDAWSVFGEDAKVVDSQEKENWDSSDSIMMFIENVATPMERDWRALDPRRLVEEDDFPEDDK